MRDLLSKLDKIVAEETTLQDLEQHPMAKDPVIAKAIADKKRQEQPEETLENDDVSEDIFQIGDDFGISFTEDFEIATEISDILEDGILIDLDEHAIELLQNEGITFVDVDLIEAKKKGLDGKACWKGYRYAGTKMKGGKRVDNCVKVGEDSDVEESGLQYYTGKKKYGKDGMAALAQAGREGASEEELGRIKDKYKKEDTELEEKSYPFAGRAVGHKEGPAGQWRNKGPKANKPARTGDLVGGTESVEHDVDNCVKVGEKQVPAGGTLREFAPYSGDGSGARWYNDDELADLLGDEWLQDLDVSSKLGDIELTKDMTGSADPAVAYLVDMAQRWLDAQGYHVRVLSARDNEDEGNLDWLIDGIFYRDLDRAKLQQAAQNEHDYYAKLYVNLLSQLEDTTWHDRAGAWLHARRSLDGGRISLDNFKKKIQAMELEVKKKKGLPESTLGTTDINEAEYQGRKVQLGKPMAGDVKKSKVYVRGPKGNVVKVNFGDKKMKIKKSNPKRRKSFRARHNCANPGPRWKARYWSCRAW